MMVIFLRYKIVFILRMIDCCSTSSKQYFWLPLWYLQTLIQLYTWRDYVYKQ